MRLTWLLVIALFVGCATPKHDVVLNWKSTHAPQYNVYRVDNGVIQKLGSTPVNSYVDPTAVSGRYYMYYVVGASEELGESGPSNTIYVNVP